MPIAQNDINIVDVCTDVLLLFIQSGISNRVFKPGKVDRLLLVPDGEAATPVPFPKYKFIVALNNSGPDHPLYNATYYSLVAWFSAFKKGLGWFMQFCERFGSPKPVLHYDNPQDRICIYILLHERF